MATDPDMTKKDLIAKMKKRKIDTEKSPSAITTAFSSMRTCTRLLRENGLMATPKTSE